MAETPSQQVQEVRVAPGVTYTGRPFAADYRIPNPPGSANENTIRRRERRKRAKIKKGSSR
jgi:hypothetical protein